MELQFRKTPLNCLRRAAWEVKNEEQTQEVKIPEAMPDIGKVLGAWGQPVIRGKEWRGSSMSMSGGVMAWVLYAPEDGSGPRTVESWIPFQMRWDFPQTQRDGSMIFDCRIANMDARTVSARKLMVRCSLSVAGEALEPAQMDIYAPDDLPEDIQVLRNAYPVRLPVEAGEKTFLLDEELPATCDGLEKLMYYTLQPEITEKKVLADKVIFRGVARLHGLCRCDGGELKTCDYELPFSQYSELENLYEPYATVRIIPGVTSVELEMQEDGNLHLKAGMVGQYVVSDRPMLEVVEDAYSNTRSVELKMQELELPVILEERQEQLKAEQSADAEGNRIVDVSFTAAQPTDRRREDMLRMQMPGNFQMLCYADDGILQSVSARWDGDMEIPVPEQADIMAWTRWGGNPQGSLGGGNASFHTDVVMDMMTVSEAGISMVTALELGETVESDPQRPSLILCRRGDDSLWSVAKRCGSTVDAIRQANDLMDDGEDDRMLLIPVS